MKKTISVFLILLTVFSLCACSTNAIAEEPALSAAPAKDNGKYLSELMTEFAENLQPGTAGSSLKAVKEAVRLMDWGMETEITAEEMEEVFEDFFSDKDDEFLKQYREQMEQLNETCKLLLTEGQEELLESAGCTGTAYPWGGEPIGTVELFFEILGRRIGTSDNHEP